MSVKPPVGSASGRQRLDLPPTARASERLPFALESVSYTVPNRPAQRRKSSAGVTPVGHRNVAAESIHKFYTQVTLSVGRKQYERQRRERRNRRYLTASRWLSSELERFRSGFQNGIQTKSQREGRRAAPSASPNHPLIPNQELLLRTMTFASLIILSFSSSERLQSMSLRKRRALVLNGVRSE